MESAGIPLRVHLLIVKCRWIPGAWNRRPIPSKRIPTKEAELLLLVQAQTDKTTVNSALTGQPFKITREWSEQTVTLAPDPAQWTCLGARHDMRDEYGCDDIDKVLADVNFDIIFILFPLKVVPAGVDIDDINIPRAVKDYPVDQQYLPKGLIMFDTVKIEYPD